MDIVQRKKMDQTPTIKSKTVQFNGWVLAIHTLLRWAFPDFEIPQDVLVAFLTLANLTLRAVTKQPLGG